MCETFSKELLHEGELVVYLKNERTGSSTVRKCKFIGQIVEFTKNKVKIMRASEPDSFVTPDELKERGIDTVFSDEIVHILWSKGWNMQHRILIVQDEYQELLEYKYKYQKLMGE